MSPRRRRSPDRRKSPPPKVQHRLWPTVLASILAVLVMAPIVFRLVGNGADYTIHRNIAVAMKAHLTLYSPHFLLQFLVLVVDFLLPGNIDAAMIVVNLLAYAATAAIILRVILHRTSSPAVAVTLTLALLLASSVALLFPIDRHLYRGYIPANVFHNPTMVLLKPLALLSFGYAAAALWPEQGAKVRTTILCALLTVACALAKPNYTVCILPALAIVAAKRGGVSLTDRLEASRIGLRLARLCDASPPVSLDLQRQPDSRCPARQQPHCVCTFGRGSAVLHVAGGQVASFAALPPFSLGCQFPKGAGGLRPDAGVASLRHRRRDDVLAGGKRAEDGSREYAMERPDRGLHPLCPVGSPHFSVLRRCPGDRPARRTVAGDGQPRLSPASHRVWDRLVFR